MRFSASTRRTLLFLLALLAFVTRVPFTPHEIGWDSFVMHAMADSLTATGTAGWWLHPASVFGFYPFSYASAVPFLLSEFAQWTGLGTEHAVLILDLFFGVLAVFLVASMAFTGYYQYVNYAFEDPVFARYTEDCTVDVAEWLEDQEGVRVFCVDRAQRGGVTHLGARILSMGGVPTITGFPPTDRAHGFTAEEWRVGTRSPTSTRFYAEDRFYAESNSTAWAVYNIPQMSYGEGEEFLDYYGITHVVERDGPYRSAYMRGAREELSKCYDNGRISVWVT